ncbi:MAG: hypothetical protein K2Y05_07655, partial [Hyphomicrobiaceae bacterium]|nr:hypothetical protein [Hyphomicrobiaceae bacterium]
MRGSSATGFVMADAPADGAPFFVLPSGFEPESGAVVFVALGTDAAEVGVLEVRVLWAGVLGVGSALADPVVGLGPLSRDGTSATRLNGAADGPRLPSAARAAADAADSADGLPVSADGGADAATAIAGCS